jgi:hypothetical protein
MIVIVLPKDLPDPEKRRRQKQEISAVTTGEQTGLGQIKIASQQIYFNNSGILVGAGSRSVPFWLTIKIYDFLKTSNVTLNVFVR